MCYCKFFSNIAVFRPNAHFSHVKSSKLPVFQKLLVIFSADFILNPLDLAIYFFAQPSIQLTYKLLIGQVGIALILTPPCV